MTLTTDGKVIVYCVFDNDGYECSNFVGAFGTEDEAQHVAADIRQKISAFFESNNAHWHGSVTVKPVTLGEYELPPDAAMAAEDGL